MTDARSVTKGLQGRWSGSSGVARCPAHEDRTPSLSIRDGDGGKLLTCCHAGCPPEAVWAALRDRGLVAQGDDRPSESRPRRRPQRPDKSISDPSPNQEHAIEIWHSARPAPGTVTTTYLRHRAITREIPVSIRDHPGLKHGPTGQNLPTMVGGVTGPDRKVIAIQRTFLRVDGRGKANVSQPKLTLGPMRDGAVRLGPVAAVLGIAEGVETGLSAMVLFAVPTWCSLSASRLDRLWLPHEAVEIHIFADNGTAGHEAAERAAKAYQAQGRRVVVRFPPERFGDFNDLLRAEFAVCPS